MLFDTSVRALSSAAYLEYFRREAMFRVWRVWTRPARVHMQRDHVLCRLLAGARIPVVSVVQGVGAGAAVGLVLLGDHIVVAEEAKILFPSLSLDLVVEFQEVAHSQDAVHGRLAVECAVWPMPVVAMQEWLQGCLPLS